VGSVASRVFTVGEANALIPTLERAFRRLLPVQAELRRSYAELERAGLVNPDRPIAPAAGGATPGAIPRVRGRFLALALALAEEYEGLEALGVLVRDPETGLCDFPSLRGGRPVLLCWRLGEPSVDFWHELDAGYANRLPLESAVFAHAISRGQA
jgi:hypothetical protein